MGDLHLPVPHTAAEFDEARPETVVGYQQPTPDSRFVQILGGAHLTSIDAPKAFADTVQSFLAEVERLR